MMQVYEEELPLYDFQIIGVSWGLKFCTKRSEMGSTHTKYELYYFIGVAVVMGCFYVESERDVEGYRVLYY